MSIRLTPPPEREFPAGRLQQRKEQLVSQIHGASDRNSVAPSAANPCGSPPHSPSPASSAAAAYAGLRAHAGP